MAYTQGSNLYVVQADVEGINGDFTIPASVDADELTKFIFRASSAVDAFTHDHWGYTPMVIELDGEGNDFLNTRQVTSWRLVKITAIKARDYPDESFSETVDATTYLIARGRSGVRRVVTSVTASYVTNSAANTGVWFSGVHNYQLTGYFGHKVIPDLLKHATALLVRELITPGSINQFEKLASESFADGYSYTRAGVSAAASAQNRTMIGGRTTGHPYVDQLLIPFVRRRPSFIVPGA